MSSLTPASKQRVSCGTHVRTRSEKCETLSLPSPRKKSCAPPPPPSGTFPLNCGKYSDSGNGGASSSYRRHYHGHTTSFSSSNEKRSRVTFNNFYKTKLCPWYIKGSCHWGASCNYAHTISEQREAVDLTRTKLCPAWLKQGECQNTNCRFAHDYSELRATTDVFKTALCSFYVKGIPCPMESSCRFAHGVHEVRPRGGLTACTPNIGNKKNSYSITKKDGINKGILPRQPQHICLAEQTNLAAAAAAAAGAAARAAAAAEAAEEAKAAAAAAAVAATLIPKKVFSAGGQLIRVPGIATTVFGNTSLEAHKDVIEARKKNSTGSFKKFSLACTGAVPRSGPDEFGRFFLPRHPAPGVLALDKATGTWKPEEQLSEALTTTATENQQDQQLHTVSTNEVDKTRKREDPPIQGETSYGRLSLTSLESTIEALLEALQQQQTEGYKRSFEKLAEQGCPGRDIPAPFTSFEPQRSLVVTDLQPGSDLSVQSNNGSSWCCHRDTTTFAAPTGTVSSEKEPFSRRALTMVEFSKLLSTVAMAIAAAPITTKNSLAAPSYGSSRSSSTPTAQQSTRVHGATVGRSRFDMSSPSSGSRQNGVGAPLACPESKELVELSSHSLKKPEAAGTTSSNETSTLPSLSFADAFASSCPPTLASGRLTGAQTLVMKGSKKKIMTSGAKNNLIPSTTSTKIAPGFNDKDAVVWAQEPTKLRAHAISGESLVPVGNGICSTSDSFAICSEERVRRGSLLEDAEVLAGGASPRGAGPQQSATKIKEDRLEAAGTLLLAGTSSSESAERADAREGEHFVVSRQSTSAGGESE